jgi:hypothetical protein
MVLGLSIQTFTMLHVAISIVGIVAGLVVLYGFFGTTRSGGWTALFLATTILTSVTGFLFPSPFGPAHVIGIISLVLLAAAVAALYFYDLAGPWRWVYALTAICALYLNLFVAVVQAFQKVAVLQPLAPTQSEPPFQIAQGALLLLFIVAGIMAVRRFHPQT